MGTKVNQEDVKQAVYLYKIRKMTLRKIADEIGKTDACIGTIIQTFNAVESKDWDEIIRLVEKRNLGVNMLNACANELGVIVPSFVYEAYRKNRKTREEEKAKKRFSAAQKTEINLDQSNSETIDGEKQISSAIDEDSIARVMYALGKIDEHLENIGKWLTKLYEDTNANADNLHHDIMDAKGAICQQVKKMPKTYRGSEQYERVC